MRHILLLIVVLAGFCWHATASAIPVPTTGASIWRPTDSDTNYMSLGQTGESTVSFALFDYDETSRNVDLDAKLEFKAGDLISFFERDGEWFAMNDSDLHPSKLLLGSSDWFVIAANDGCVWVFDDGMPETLGTNIYALEFLFDSGFSAELQQADAKHVGRLATLVPAPPAALLLASGLLTLVRAGRIAPPLHTLQTRRDPA